MFSRLLSRTFSVVVAVESLVACGGGGGAAPQAVSPTANGGDSSIGGASASAGTAGDMTPAAMAGAAGAAMVKAKGVTVTPVHGLVAPSGNLQFTAIVNGLSATTVTWKVTEGDSGGKISDAGLYTAPGTSGAFHITATSTADSTFSDSVVVTVAQPAGTRPTLTPGVWANISPPITLTGANSGGLVSVALDPSDPLTLYVGVDTLTDGAHASEGMWRSKDGGSSWARVGSGTDTDVYDDTSQFIDLPIAIAVDPKDPKHLYATEGVRGADNGFWISTDGGDNWIRPAGFKVSPSNDVTTLAIDPSDFNHVLVGCHTTDNLGVIESKDGGQTWTVHPPPANGNWPGGTFGISFLYSPSLGLGDANTWLVHHDGFWRTTDAGTTWNKVSDIAGVHGATETYYAKNGVLYSGAATSLARSTDNGLTWAAITQGVPSAVYYTVSGDGNSLYAGPDSQAGSPIITSAAADSLTASKVDGGMTWSDYSGNQVLGRGPLMLRFDPANRILYAAAWTSGLWALKVLDP